MVPVDANILVYAVDKDSAFHDRSLNFLYDPERILFTTSKNISEFLVVLTKYPEFGLSGSECLEVLDSLLDYVGVLYSNRRTYEVFRKLFAKYNPRGLWIHDLEIASIGIAHGITTVATYNVTDFERLSEIRVLAV